LRAKRTPYELVWEILEYCSKPRKVTHIIQGCNLNTNRARRYVDLLINKNLLRKTGEHYKTTKKGIKYLKMIEEVYRAIFLRE